MAETARRDAETGYRLPAVSVVGLGKLGACTAACFAYQGVSTIGVDLNPGYVASINAGHPPVFEPRLDEILAAGRSRIAATTDYREALEASEISFLIVPTPSRPDGSFSDEHLRDALRHLSTALRESKKSYHLFAVTSTVSPGKTEGSLTPLIEELSGRRLNEGFGVCYNPEFIALGSVIQDFLNPDLVLIGESDAKAGAMLEDLYRRVCENTPVVARMSLVSAEITKISLNAYVTMKISFANTLAQICQAVPGAEIDAVTRALGADRRVSPYGLRGGPPYGGPCFPRDNRAFTAFAAQYGVDARLSRATDEMNRSQTEYLLRLVLQGVESHADRRVAVLGVAYKPNTPVIEESASLALIEGLLGQGLDVTVFDPLAMENARALFGDRVHYASSVRDCLSGASIAVVATPAREFAGIDASYFTHNPMVMVDCWRLLDRSKLGTDVQYVALGVCDGRTA